MSDESGKTSSQEPTAAPVIEFPCRYPIKVICDASPSVVANVHGILRKYDSSLTMAKIELQPSKKGTYCSVRVDFFASGKEQLMQLFTELKIHKWVRMVL